MPWRLNSRLDPDDRIPVDVRGVVPGDDWSRSSLAGYLVHRGRRRHRLEELFDVQAHDAGPDLLWSGPLHAVHRLGALMSTGTVLVEGDCGRHVGSQMSGGTLRIAGSASDYLGAEMTGGKLFVAGNAGDCVGGAYPGTRSGMNRGTIVVGGDVGDSLGQAIRRGTILVGGQSGALTGWNMNAGTLVVLGGTGEYPGAGMRRGTIVCGPAGRNPVRLLPSMMSGPEGRFPILTMLKRWLVELLASETPAPISIERLEPFDEPWQLFHGDQLHGGRGELLLPAASPSPIIAG